MLDHIKLSHNELWALLTRTFEALYGHRRDYYDMARSVLWLECYGLDGVAGLVQALPVLEKNSLPKPTLTEHSSSHTVMDGGGRSLFCLSRAICDLAMANAAETGEGRIDVINVTDEVALIGVLSYAAQQGFASAFLGDTQSAVMVPTESCPVIFEGNIARSVSFTCTRNNDDIKKHLPPVLQERVTSQTQIDYFNASLESGLTISRTHYNTLNNVADRVLVEASAASRRGAGE